MKFFTSDPHFSHGNIIKWGRPRFNSIEEHDEFLVSLWEEWANKFTVNDQFWVLGDWGNLEFLPLMSMFKCPTYFMYGNHDRHNDIDMFKRYFDVVYEYPVYIQDTICISHTPQAVFDDQLNIHGHLHGNIIDKINYVSCCLEVNNYKIVSEKRAFARFQQMPRYNRKFLQEPYAEWQKVIIRPENDLILKPNGHIDISAQRAKLELLKLEKK